MNKLDMLKVQLAENGWDIKPTPKGFLATKWVLTDYPDESACLHIEGFRYDLGDFEREELVEAKIHGPIPGVTTSLSVSIEIRDLSPDKVMSDLPRIARSLQAGYKALVQCE